MTRHSTTVIFLCTLLLGLPVMVLAQSPEDMTRARAAHKKGQQLYQQGDYPGALDHFSRGYKLSGKSGFLFNMAESARQIGSKETAREMYMRYVRKHPTGKHRATALQMCLQLKVGPCPMDGVLEQPGGPRDELPDKLPPLPKAKARVTTPPPAGVSRTRPATHLKTGALKPVEHPQKDYLPPPPPPAGVHEESSTPFYKHWAFWTGVGAVIIAGGVTAVVLATRSDSGDGSPPSDYVIEY